jgi:GMP synthase (glutamine-hydrolysing)
VHPGTAGFELGVHPITLERAAARDRAFRGLPTDLPVAHWHGDTYDPVPGAEELGRTALYPWQAFRLGSSYGLQFHPELEARTFLQWVEVCPQDVRRSGKPKATLVEEARRLESSAPAWKTFLEAMCRGFIRG